MLSAVIKSPFAPFSRRDAIVVLGCPPGRTLDERTQTAAALFAAGGAPRVIATGRGEAASVVAALPHAELEDRASSTAENAAFVAAMLPAGASVWLVTHRFHARRAVYLFARAGLDAAAWPASDRLRATWLLHELGGWLKAIVARSHRAALRQRCSRASARSRSPDPLHRRRSS